MNPTESELMQIAKASLVGTLCADMVLPATALRACYEAGAAAARRAAALHLRAVAAEKYEGDMCSDTLQYHDGDIADILELRAEEIERGER